jgi:hypothetical protein
MNGFHNAPRHRADFFMDSQSRAFPHLRKSLQLSRDCQAKPDALFSLLPRIPDGHDLLRVGSDPWREGMCVAGNPSAPAAPQWRQVLRFDFGHGVTAHSRIGERSATAWENRF